MKTKNLFIALALLTAMIVGLVLIAQASVNLVAGDNMNPGMPGGAQMPGDGAPGSGGEPGIAPGVEPKWPFLGFHDTGDGMPGSGAGTGGTAPQGKHVFHDSGNGKPGSGAGTGGTAPGPKTAFHSGGAGFPGSGAGTGGTAPQGQV